MSEQRKRLDRLAREIVSHIMDVMCIAGVTPSGREFMSQEIVKAMAQARAEQREEDARICESTTWLSAEWAACRNACANAIRSSAKAEGGEG